MEGKATAEATDQETEEAMPVDAHMAHCSRSMTMDNSGSREALCNSRCSPTQGNPHEDPCKAEQGVARAARNRAAMAAAQAEAWATGQSPTGQMADTAAAWVTAKAVVE